MKVDSGLGRKTFELTLMNGDPYKITVTGEEEGLLEVSELTLDTAGMGNTLHLLEGIATEGKKWIDNERVREMKKVTQLAEASGTVFDQSPPEQDQEEAPEG
ncbi:hypothetical protein GT755_09325 [Herbidospora sp. NEAU-GS84]|uniref:Uncharacterized protein n=1 Tax=Herbidospora solisilvae TaxID=2696284 RepID=A0A7C9JAX4_9ACTN|nr:hypothetical protein [Herbidospora solisilvae]NAS21884.1 hypothetical protein [Herbidospora solisilvae]